MSSHVRRGVAVQQGKWGLESELVLSSTSLLCCLHFLRFFTGLALLQQEQKASEDTEKEAALFLQQGLERFISQRCSKRFVCVVEVEVEVDAVSGSVRARQFQECTRGGWDSEKLSHLKKTKKKSKFEGEKNKTVEI